MTRFICDLRKDSIIVCYLQSDDIGGDRNKNIRIAADTGGGAMDVYKVVWEIGLGIKGGIVSGWTCIALFARGHVCVLIRVQVVAPVQPSHHLIILPYPAYSARLPCESLRAFAFVPPICDDRIRLSFYSVVPSPHRWSIILYGEIVMSFSQSH